MWNIATSHDLKYWVHKNMKSKNTGKFKAVMSQNLSTRGVTATFSSANAALECTKRKGLLSVKECWEGVVALRSNTSRVMISYTKCFCAWGTRDLPDTHNMCMNVCTFVPENPSSIIRHYAIVPLQSGFTKVPSVSHRHGHDYAKNEMGHRTRLECVSRYVCMCMCVDQKKESRWKCIQIIYVRVWLGSVLTEQNSKRKHHYHQ